MKKHIYLIWTNCSKQHLLFHQLFAVQFYMSCAAKLTYWEHQQLCYTWCLCLSCWMKWSRPFQTLSPPVIMISMVHSSSHSLCDHYLAWSLYNHHWQHWQGYHHCQYSDPPPVYWTLRCLHPWLIQTVCCYIRSVLTWGDGHGQTKSKCVYTHIRWQPGTPCHCHQWAQIPILTTEILCYLPLHSYVRIILPVSRGNQKGSIIIFSEKLNPICSLQEQYGVIPFIWPQTPKHSKYWIYHLLFSMILVSYWHDVIFLHFLGSWSTADCRSSPSNLSINIIINTL